MPRPVTTSAAYYPGLDGLRAVAVGLVVAYHIGVPFAGGGLLGVGVFFTISGFLITSLLLSRWEKHGNLDLKNFWIRRFRRLLPAVVLLLAAVLAATAILAPHNLGRIGAESLAALLYVANWHTIYSGKSYFEQQEGVGPLDHLWSLAVEEQFYIVWPLLLLGLLTLCRGRFKKAAVVTFVLGAGSMLLLSALADPGADPTRAYEGTDTRAGGLLWGAVLAMLWRPARIATVTGGRARALLDGVGVVGLAGIFWLVATTDQQSHSLYTWGIAALTVTTCLALMPLMHPQSVFGRVLGVGPMRWIGERSYGIYLWHMPVVAFLPDRVLYGQDVARGALIVGLTLVLAEISWRFVEDPIRRHGFLALVTGRARREQQTTPTTQAEVTPAARRAPGLVAIAAGGLGVMALSAASLVGLSALPQKSVVDIAQEANRGKDQKASADSNAQDRSAARPTAAATQCTDVVHVGDSSSLGASNDEKRTEISDPSKRITAQYEAVGVENVTEDVLGGRSMLEHMDRGGKDTNAPEALEENASKLGADGCWVVNVGLNDAANMAKAGDFSGAQKRIDSVMAEADGKPVLWVTALTMPWVNNEHYDNENVQKFNEALMQAAEKHDNLWVYDWSAEASEHPEWFLEDDANHNNEEGSIAKADRMAKALVAAFPEGEEPSKERVVLAE